MGSQEFDTGAPTPAVVSYTLGPISAGANSPLGGLLGWMNGLSSSFDTGLRLATVSPALSGAVIGGQPVDPANVRTALSVNPNPSGSPFVGIGQLIGAILGTGINAIGVTVGTAGTGASTGVSSGLRSGVSGLATVGSSGATGGFTGLIEGLGTGTVTGLSGASPTLLFIALIVLIIIMAS